jgi:hypothetical protein
VYFVVKSWGIEREFHENSGAKANARALKSGFKNADLIKSFSGVRGCPLRS